MDNRSKTFAFFLASIFFTCFVSNIDAIGYECTGNGLIQAAAAGGNVTFFCTSPTFLDLTGWVLFNKKTYIDGGNFAIIRGLNVISVFTLDEDVSLSNLKLQQIRLNNRGGIVRLTNVTMTANYVNDTMANMIDNYAFLYLNNFMLYNSRSYGGLILNRGYLYCSSSTITNAPLSAVPGSSAVDIIARSVITEFVFCTVAGFEKSVSLNATDSGESVTAYASIFTGTMDAAAYVGNYNLFVEPNPGFPATYRFNTYSTPIEKIFDTFSDTLGYSLVRCSPAVNGVDPKYNLIPPFPTKDQNSQPRNRGGAPDIGAVESELKTCLTVTGNYNVTESAGRHNLTLTLSSITFLNTTLSYQIRAGSAVEGRDFKITGSPTGTLTYVSPNLKHTLSVEIINNNYYQDNNIDFYIKLFGASENIQFPDVDNRYIIINDDPFPVVQFNRTSFSVDEDIGNVSIPITLSNPSLYGIQVTVETKIPNSVDNFNSTTVFIFPPFSVGSNQSIVVSLTGDNVYRGNYNITGTISNIVNATIGPIKNININVNDDDFPSLMVKSHYNVSEGDAVAYVTIMLSNPSAFASSVYYTFNYTGPSHYPILMTTATPNPITFPPLKQSYNMTFAITDDNVHENNEQYLLTFFNPDGFNLNATKSNVLLLDNDIPIATFKSNKFEINETMGKVIFPLEIKNTSLDAITLVFRVVGLTATAGKDYNVITASPLTYAPGVTVQNIEIEFFNDTIREYTEYITLEIVSVNNGVVIGKNGIVNVSIIDMNEDPSATFDFSGNSNNNYYEVQESVGNVDIPIKLSYPTAFDGTIHVVVDSTIAVEGKYYDIPSTVVFSNYSTEGYLRVAVDNNNIYETNRTIQIFLNFSSSSYLKAGAKLNASIFIVDNDPYPSLGFDKTDVITLVSREKERSIDISVLFSNPTIYGVSGVMSVNGSAVEGEDYTITESSLEFAPLAVSKVISIASTGKQTKDKAEKYLEFKLITSENATIDQTKSSVKIVFNQRYRFGSLKDSEVYAIIACSALVAVGAIAAGIAVGVKKIMNKHRENSATGLEMNKM